VALWVKRVVFVRSTSCRLCTRFGDTWLLGGATFLALAFGFWTFLNLNITSMRIRILRELLRAGGCMALSDMAEIYTPAERLRRRLERLEKAAR
jgi:hypothetical protein